MERSVIFAEVRKISGKLTKDQVIAGDKIMDELGEEILGTLLGVKMGSKLLTAEKLLKIYPGANTAFVDPINRLADKYEINTVDRMAVFLAQTLLETGGYKSLRENLNYSAKRLVEVFPTRVKTLKEAQALVAKGQVSIADAVYGGRFGNGINNGDGYRYRGGGLTHTTFKDNYAVATKHLNANGNKTDLVTNPEKIADPDIAVESAMIYWKTRNVNKYADKKDIEGASVVVNGGTNGLRERTKLYEKAMIIL